MLDINKLLLNNHNINNVSHTCINALKKGTTLNQKYDVVTLMGSLYPYRYENKKTRRLWIEKSEILLDFIKNHCKSYFYFCSVEEPFVTMAEERFKIKPTIFDVKNSRFEYRKYGNEWVYENIKRKSSEHYGYYKF